MKITIIGAGAMGGAMAEGLLQSEKFIPSDITVSDHNQPVLDHFASKGASVTLDNQLACHGADIVCVVVKPWCVEKTLKGIKDALDYKSQKLVVVAAGVPSANIKEWLDKDGITGRTSLPCCHSHVVCHRLRHALCKSQCGRRRRDGI